MDIQRKQNQIGTGQSLITGFSGWPHVYYNAEDTRLYHVFGMNQEIDLQLGHGKTLLISMITRVVILRSWLNG